MMISQLSAESVEVVTPSDTKVISGNTRAIYIGGYGDVSITTRLSKTPVVFTAVPAGLIIPVNVYKVMSTGTTATHIVALK